MVEKKISVRNMIEFILRDGDIDNRKDTGSDPDAMQEGIRIHKMIQKSMPVGYVSEVGLKERFEDDGIALILEGRADGIWHKEEDGKTAVIIDEIKSMYANLTYVENPKPIHLAQAKCYAAIYAKQEGLERIGVQMTYCDIDTEEIKRFRFNYNTDELVKWLQGVVDKYFVWVHMEEENRVLRNATISTLDFPYDYRPGQKEVAIDVYRSIKRSRNLFIQAPTGVGKTLSVFYPSIKAMGEELSDKIFYLTAKTVTATVATDTIKLLTENGLSIKSIHITAKEKSCANDLFDCNPDVCPYADRHYDRVNDAVYDIITHENVITREVILDYAEKHRVCPYEFSLDISLWCDVIIGDYNYAFDPRVRLRRYFENETDSDYILLIDEAHNLVSRACEMYSASIVKEDILECGRMTKGMSKSLTNAITSANRKMLELKRECDEDYVLYSDVADLAKSVERLYSELSKLLEKQKFFDTRKEVLEFFFKVKTFYDVYYNMLRGYKIYGRIQYDGSFAVKLLCIDPSDNIQECLASCRTAVFFSATLLPINYYKELLTGDTDDYAIYAETSFTSDQRLLAAAKDVSSKYTRRTKSEYEKIARYIEEVTSAKPGNYLVFFPSYEFQRQVGECLDIDKTAQSSAPDEFSAHAASPKSPANCRSHSPSQSVLINNQEHSTERKTRYIIQTQHMSEREREEFLAEFEEENDETLVGLCVMGGIFSEGIDLTDERLIGAIVVGTGLPMINAESEIAKEYFNQDEKDGFAYAYRYPGMNKVMQAAGRVIRKETDKGVILLLDERFNYSEYRSLFPKEWSDCKIVSADTVKESVENFWNKQKGQ